MRHTSYLKPLLSWYQDNKRDLPWRQSRDPYRIWLSEIMLQQTTVAAVIPYYEKFLRLWPDVNAIAAAKQDQILAAWAGLGYYSRARNLHRTAQQIVTDYNGQFPKTFDELKKLSGIGPYTAGAIAAIAFNEKKPAVDGNVIRVLSRVFGIATPMPLLVKDITHKAQDLMNEAPKNKAGDLVQALMELGATICTPRKPNCPACPWQSVCIAFAENAQEFYPVKPAKKEKPKHIIKVYWLENGKDEILLTRRPQNWMLGGMMALPSTALTSRETDHKLASQKIKWQITPEKIKHSFTHFDAELVVHCAKTKSVSLSDSDLWISQEQLQSIGLPTLFAKVAKTNVD